MSLLYLCNIQVNPHILLFHFKILLFHSQQYEKENLNLNNDLQIEQTHVRVTVTRHGIIGVEGC